MFKIFNSENEENFQNKELSAKKATGTEAPTQVQPQSTIATNINNTDRSETKNGSIFSGSNTNAMTRDKIQPIVSQIRQASDGSAALDVAVREIKSTFGIDRVLIYQFENNNAGKVAAEALWSGFTPMLGETVSPLTFGAANAKEYQIQGAIATIVNSGNISPYQKQLLEHFQIQSSLSVPIFFRGYDAIAKNYGLHRIWGLLVLQSCRQVRNWSENEINFLDRISLELTLALQTSQPLLQTVQQGDLSARINSEALELMQGWLDEIRQSLKVDRSLVYAYYPDGSGKTLAESFDSAWSKVGSALENDWVAGEETKEIYVVNDISTKKFPRCLLEEYAKIQAKAYIVVPIYQGKELLGLLSIFQNSAPRSWQEGEIELMRQYAERFSFPLQQTAVGRNEGFKNKKAEIALKRERAFNKILDRIRNATDEKIVWQIATQEGRKLLNLDRLGVYRFNPDWSGYFVAESATPGWVDLVTNSPLVADTYLQETQGGRYKTGGYLAIEDIYLSGHQECHIEILESFEARAYVLTPIFTANNKLWGLLGAYQNTATRRWQEDEIDALKQIGLQVGIAMQQILYIKQLETRAEQEKAINKITERVRQSFAIEDIFKNVSQALRQTLKVDRSVVYQFNEDWSGQVIAEAVSAGWTSLLVEQQDDAVLMGNLTREARCILRKWDTKDITAADTYLQETQGGRYAQGDRVTAINDIYKANFSNCYIEFLEKYQAKAYVIAPIFQGEKLWGLLGVYQNSESRNWEQSEAELVVQIANQVSLALQQANLVGQLQNSNAQITQKAEREAAMMQLSSRAVSRLAELSQENGDASKILNFAAEELRKLLKLDRVGILHLNPSRSGKLVVESVGANCVRILGTPQAEIGSIAKKDLESSESSKGEEAPIWEQWGAKSYLLAPISKGDTLWGLLGIFQNGESRIWDASERNLLKQIATQIGVALQLSEYLSQTIEQEKQLSSNAAREKEARENLEREALNILKALEPSFRGDLTVRAPLSETEIGTIADGYNTTIQSLRELVRKVQTAAASVSKTSSSNNNLVIELSTQAKREVRQLERALEQVRSIAVSSQEVASFAKKIEQMVAETNDTVMSGDDLMEQTVAEIAEIRTTVAETGKKIKRLGETFQKISKVVNLIENFATQTNLLALNAAIEATRAGEYGKGFAVVADEVRSLAYQSANATTEISRLVEEIRTSTNEVTEAMEIGIAQVVQGTQLVNNTRQNSFAIVQATGEIGASIELITKSANTQNEQAQILTDFMQEVATLANHTSDSAAKIASSFRELLATSNNLENSVSQFKVD
jgi:methyl-accepting chemotaxis protein PixJ